MLIMLLQASQEGALQISGRCRKAEVSASNEMTHFYIRVENFRTNIVISVIDYQHPIYAELEPP